MKIYILTQSTVTGWDTYDSIVVCAENEEDAKTITPNEEPIETQMWIWPNYTGCIQCTEIGTANESQKRGLILASFNAG